MNSTSKEKTVFRILIMKSIEGQISNDEIRQFDVLLKTYPDLINYYIKCMQLQAGLCEIRDFEVNDIENNLLCDEYIWSQMAENEKVSPAIEIHKEKPQSELIQKVVYPPREKRKMSTFSKVILIMNTAAIFFIVLFLKFAPNNPVEVATLSDSINAKWADIDAFMQKGVRLSDSSEKLMLREGLAELIFDNGAKAVIEAPAEFQILTDDRVGLKYGKIYVAVPLAAVGFSVYTPNAKIIDMGTEFGVQTDFNGSTQVHVLKGETVLMAGETEKVSMEVSAGSAKKISAETGEISDTGFRTDYFVRAINSESNCIWRGQKIIDLADIVGGGNGFGTGTIDMGIDLISGKPSSELLGNRAAANDYRPVPSNPFIDGVFVPNGQTTQIVSSQGHLFQECPITSGLFCQNIINQMYIFDSQAAQDMKVSDSPAHSLLLHANMGITFDLQAIRGLMTGVDIVRFQSKFGIRKWALRPTASSADFWVLVDGKVRSVKQQVKIGELHSVDIELSVKDRFLTLIETEGTDPEDQALNGLVTNPIDSDWGMFADPILVVEPK